MVNDQLIQQMGEDIQNLHMIAHTLEAENSQLRQVLAMPWDDSAVRGVAPWFGFMNR